MSELADAAEGVLALAFGGFLFITVGGALTRSMTGPSLIDLQFWGVTYVIAAIVLAVLTVIMAARSILD